MKSEKKIIAIICARSGSKGLKNKNLKLFNKKPLIYYPINAALKSGVIDDVLVTTDSENCKSCKKIWSRSALLRSKSFLVILQQLKIRLKMLY